MSPIRAPRRLAAALATTVVAALLLPAGAAHAADPPTLQVSKEIAITSGSTLELKATISPAAAGTKINFAVLPAPNEPGANPAAPNPCTTDANGSCSVSLLSNQQGKNLVRAWIEGTSADVTEGRLANDKSDLLPPLLGPSAADCGPGDSAACHDGSATSEGAVAEPDATDVVSVEWLNFSVGHLDCADGNPADGADVEYNDGPAPETYTCSLTTLAGAPIAGAWIDAKVLPSMKTAGAGTTADLNDLCKTDGDGRCTTTDKVQPPSGPEVLCFWAEPNKGSAPNQPPPSQGENNVYASSGPTTDGGACSQRAVTEAEGNDVTDVVYLDVAAPRAEGLDVQPEDITVQGGTRFSLRSTVYDQFGHPFNKGGVKLQAKLFDGSVLLKDNPNPDLTCTTVPGADTCSILTPAQNDLGTNLACVWLTTPDKHPSGTVSDASQESATCNGGPALWQSADDKDLREAHVDATGDDGPPSPVTDGIDVVRFSVQSKPAIFTVSPNERRQSTSGDVLGIDGINFLPSAQITVSGAGVNIGPTAVVSSKRLEASLSVDTTAAPGARDVTVTNRSDGGKVTCSGCFRVIGQGYWMVASDGGVFNYGDAPFVGSAGGSGLNKPIVAMAPTPSGKGYWMVASDGGVFNYGDAPFVGSAGGLNLAKPIVSMAPTTSGRGYWLVSSDGGVFGYGDAKFYGATTRLTLAKPIVSIVATPSGRGYWLLASDGGIFSFGDAKFFGSTGGLVLNQPIVAMAPTKSGKGYWLVASDGGIFAYGDARFFGSTGDIKLNQPIVGMTATPLGGGYWMVASDGGIFSFGDARFFGSTGDIKLNKPIVGLARR